jgi:creatinine amidohydrolase
MYLAELTSPQLAALPRETPIVFPIAALEQHGGHLPVLTDTQLVGEVVRRAELMLSQEVVFAPVLWLGNSDHHLDFPGTLSAPPRPYLDVLVGLAENVLRHGFKRVIFFVNGTETPTVCCCSLRRIGASVANPSSGRCRVGGCNRRWDMPASGRLR